VRLLLTVACCFSAAACAVEPSPSPGPAQEVDATEEKAPAPRPEGSASIDGTIDGAPVTLTSAVAIPGSLSEKAPEHRGVRIVLRNQPGVCAGPTVIHPGAQALTLDVEARTLKAGTYDVADILSGGKGVHARFDHARVACNNSTLLAQGGSVTITENDGVTVRGTFALTIAREHVTGRFEAPLCETPPSGFVDLDERCVP
jgi:hypothetical protein